MIKHKTIRDFLGNTVMPEHHFRGKKAHWTVFHIDELWEEQETLDDGFYMVEWVPSVIDDTAVLIAHLREDGQWEVDDVTQPGSTMTPPLLPPDQTKPRAVATCSNKEIFEEVDDKGYSYKFVHALLQEKPSLNEKYVIIAASRNDLKTFYGVGMFTYETNPMHTEKSRPFMKIIASFSAYGMPPRIIDGIDWSYTIIGRIL